MTKDVTIGEGRYQLGKMTARAASRIYNLFVASMLKMVREQNVPDTETPAANNGTEESAAEATVAFLWASLSTTLAEDTYTSIQNQCLAVCARYLENGAPHPLLMKDGSNRWALPDLEQDAPLVNRLIVEVLRYNIGPFFRERVFGDRQGAATVPSLSNVPV